MKKTIKQIYYELRDITEITGNDEMIPVVDSSNKNQSAMTAVIDLMIPIFKDCSVKERSFLLQRAIYDNDEAIFRAIYAHNLTLASDQQIPGAEMKKAVQYALPTDNGQILEPLLKKIENISAKDKIDLLALAKKHKKPKAIETITIALRKHFQKASIEGDIGAVIQIINYNDLIKPEDEKIINPTDMGITLGLVAVGDNCSSHIIKSLLNNQTSNIHLQSALHNAASRGHEDACAILLDYNKNKPPVEQISVEFMKFCSMLAEENQKCLTIQLGDFTGHNAHQRYIKTKEEINFHIKINEFKKSLESLDSDARGQLFHQLTRQNTKESKNNLPALLAYDLTLPSKDRIPKAVRENHFINHLTDRTSAYYNHMIFNHEVNLSPQERISSEALEKSLIKALKEEISNHEKDDKVISRIVEHSKKFPDQYSNVILVHDMYQAVTSTDRHIDNGEEITKIMNEHRANISNDLKVKCLEFAAFNNDFDTMRAIFTHDPHLPYGNSLKIAAQEHATPDLLNNLLQFDQTRPESLRLSTEDKRQAFRVAASVGAVELLLPERPEVDDLHQVVFNQNHGHDDGMEVEGGHEEYMAAMRGILIRLVQQNPGENGQAGRYDHLHEEFIIYQAEELEELGDVDDRNGNDKAELVGMQGTHHSSVHKSIDATLKNFANHYQLDDTKVAAISEAWLKWSNELEASSAGKNISDREGAAARGIKQSLSDSKRNSKVGESGLTLEYAMATLWCAAHDPAAVEVHEPFDLADRKALLVSINYDIQRGYNLVKIPVLDDKNQPIIKNGTEKKHFVDNGKPDNRICMGGAFNKIGQGLKEAHKDAKLLYITKRTIGYWLDTNLTNLFLEKMPEKDPVTAHQFYTEHYNDFGAFAAGDGISDKLWLTVRDELKQRYHANFENTTLENNKRDAAFTDFENAKISQAPSARLKERLLAIAREIIKKENSIAQTKGANGALKRGRSEEEVGIIDSATTQKDSTAEAPTENKRSKTTSPVLTALHRPNNWVESTAIPPTAQNHPIGH